MQAVGPEAVPSGRYPALVSVPRLHAAGINWGSAEAVAAWLNAGNEPDYIGDTPAGPLYLWAQERIVWSIQDVPLERYILVHGPSPSGPWAVVGEATLINSHVIGGG